jgi:hypothetical protein
MLRTVLVHFTESEVKCGNSTLEFQFDSIQNYRPWNKRIYCKVLSATLQKNAVDRTLEASFWQN